MGTVSEQFRAYAGIEGDPDTGLGLENAKVKAGGKPVVPEDRLDALHPAQASDTKVASTDTGERVAEKKAERGEKQAAKKTAAKKAATPKKQTADKAATSNKTAKKAAAKRGK